MEYEIVSGIRNLSKLIYVVNEKQLYKIKSKIANKTYYTCHNENCKVRILINNGRCEKIKNSTSFI